MFRQPRLAPTKLCRFHISQTASFENKACRKTRILGEEIYWEIKNLKLMNLVVKPNDENCAMVW